MGGRAEAEWRAGPSRTLRLSLGEAPAPGEPAAKFTQADSALARNGGWGECAGQWEEPAGVGGKEGRVRAGGDRSGPGVSIKERSLSTPSPLHTPLRPPSGKERKSPVGGTLWGQGR